MKLPLFFTLGAALVAGGALAQPAGPSRGELLYSTHCIACHSTQMHWRDKRVVVDWASLKDQVGLWQNRASLGWTDEDVGEVARHLNDTIYRFPRAGGQAVAPAPWGSGRILGAASPH